MPKQKLIPRFQWGGPFSADRQLGLMKTIRQSNSVPKAGLGNLTMPTLAGAPENALKKSTARVGTGAGAAGAIGGSLGSVANLAGDLVSSFAKPGKTNTWGITEQNYKANTAADTLKTAGSWASTGATLGMAAGPVGALVGGLVGGAAGGIMGLLKAKKKVETDKKEYKDSTQMAYEDYNQKANAQQYAALAKCGAKLHVMKKIKSSKTNAVSWHGRKFKKSGGKLDKVGEVNIIPSGTLHKEKNNLGNKDKGLPIIDESGKKIFEVEREELILRLKTTKDVESLVDKYKKSNNGRHLIDLGKLLTKEITTNTHDFSGKFGMEVE